MAGKQMEGDDRHRRKKARDARREGQRPSEEKATKGGSKQRHHLPEDEEHHTKIENIRKGKQPVISENTPEVSPGSRRRER